jgi:subtilisin
MTRHRPAAVPPSVVVFFALFATVLSAQTPPQAGAPGVRSVRAGVEAGGGRNVPEDLRVRAERGGRVRVLVELRLTDGHVAEGLLGGRDAVAAQRGEIAAAGDRVASALASTDRRIVHRYQTVPFVAMDVGPGALAALESAPDVIRVVEDEILLPVLAQSVPLIQGDQAWTRGYDGTGTTIAVIDTGIAASHPFLAGKVVNEACFSSTVEGVSRTTCPDGSDQQIGPGAAAPCSLGVCIHGTHVAGIAAGNGAPAGQPFSGVARGARLMSVQVFSEIVDPVSCGFAPPCAGAFTSDLIAGLERVYAVAASLNVVVVNMSLGGGTFAAPCDSQPYKPAIDNLRSIGVASVIAAGNDGSGKALSAPGCISSAISVGAVDKSNQVSHFSNVAAFLSLFAPGESINSAVPGNGFAVYSGTSMAAPHVAGTWAILRQAAPKANVNTILNGLLQTGRPITDTRVSGSGVTLPRVSIFDALAFLVPVINPAPELTSLAPARLRAGPSPATLTFTGSGFDAFTVAYWNGAPRPTTLLSATGLQAEISAADLAGSATAQVWVSTPAPGGGTSAALTVTIDPPPALTVSATAVAPSARVTVTLARGFGGSRDWLALASSGSSNSIYNTYTYVGAGVTERTWTVTMPSAPGPYEFRLFLNDTYTRAATSPPVNVDASLNPAPAIVSLSPGTIAAGSPGFTLIANGTGFIPSSVVHWNGSPRATTFVIGTQLQAAITAADVAAVGVASVTVVSPAPGGGASPAATFTATTPASLTVSTTTSTPGGSVTATLTNGNGGSSAWLALASTTAPNTSYLKYVGVGAGVTSRTWTVVMPTIPGSYEFRYFPTSGYTSAATSPSVAVPADPSPAPVISSLSPGAIPAGSAGFTLTVRGTDFAASSVVRWNGADRPTTFVSAAQLQASIPASDVASTGTATVRVFSPAPGGGTSTSLTLTIIPPAVLAVSASTVPGGTGVTVTLTQGTGGSGDWLAFAPASAPDSSFTQFTYVGTGVTTRTWTVTAPLTPGVYEFRLFLNNGSSRAATSPPVTVWLASNPAPSVSSLSPARTSAGSGAFTLTVNGAGFVPSSAIRWNGVIRSTTFVSSSQLRAAIAAADIIAPGSAQVTVFSPTPGGGTSLPMLFAIAPPPTLTVSATTVAPGASVTVTLTGGLGGYLDWLAFAATAAPNTSYLTLTYVGGGIDTRTWSVTMPSAPGPYEFRLFLNNGYTRAATSPQITVATQ